jgi:hypothetical protein
MGLDKEQDKNDILARVLIEGVYLVYQVKELVKEQ